MTSSSVPLSSSVASLREEIERLTEALSDALDGLYEMSAYVPPYFADKHDHKAYIQRAEKALEMEESHGRTT